ncbi:Uncharacterized protein TCAP_02576 [Tolypocladium capitatum]|uniref:Uncharacterized protein n=1 Tax=Tolypocladium capitatum TaxID=45235 RepID=A0A2K3QIY6_9HYPO|nr:Uncharacterized protein TCAP_02576 [Tolypocladium capitatum]
MPTPRTKRPFAGASADPAQRQITAFYSAVSSSEAPSSSPPSSSRSRQPLLPSSVQANLLSVGMRVRKSVPEGYKTVGTSAFKLWTDNTRPGTTPSAGDLRATSRELLPFCGINKVGGLDVQPEFRVVEEEEEGDDDPVPDLDDVPELTLSQESVDSTASEPSRKRTFADDDAAATDDTLVAWAPQPGKPWDGEVSPRSLAPVSWGNARVMAVPRSRVRKSVSFKDLGQENMALDGDFEEADFLVLGEGREMDTSG